jgi:site-specific recombinase XerC
VPESALVDLLKLHRRKIQLWKQAAALLAAQTGEDRISETASTVTTTADLTRVIDRLPKAESAKDKYRRALAHYLETGGRQDDPEAIAEDAATLPNSGRAFLKAAIGHAPADFARFAKSQATLANVAQVQAALWQAEAIGQAVETPRQKGTEADVWLSANQVRRLLATCNGDLQGRRDRLALGLLVAAGLQRSEAVALEFSDVLQKPVGEGAQSVLAIRGKGDKRREVPITRISRLLGHASVDTTSKYLDLSLDL